MKKHNRKRKSAIVLGLALIAAGNNLVYADDSQKLIGEAQSYLQKGDTKAAVIQLKNALQENSDNKEARLMLGEVYLKQGDGASAAKELKRAKDLGMADDKVLIPLGKSYLLQGRNEAVLDEIRPPAGASADLKAGIATLQGHAQLALGKAAQAKEKYNEALQNHADFPDALLGLARIAAVDKDTAGAAGLVDRALKADPQNIDAWLMKGDLQRTTGRHAESLQSFQKVLQLDSNNLSAYLGRAIEQIALGKPNEAKKDIDTVRKRAPNHPLANYLAAAMAFQEKNLTAAQDYLQQVLKIAPGHLPSLLLMGNIHYAQNQFEQAEDELSRYVKALPGNITARKLLAATLMKLKRPEDAVKALEPAIKNNSKDPQLLALLGSAYSQGGDLNKGTDYLEQAAKLAPNAAAIRTQLAVGHLAAGETELAVKELESVVDLGKEPMQADVLLVLAHLQKKNFDKALAAAQSMSRKDTGNPLPYNLMGAAYLGKKDLASARKQFEQAVKIQPKFSPAQMNLAQIDLQQGKPQQAEQRYKEILKNDDKNVGAMVALAGLSARAGKEKEAFGWLEKAREKNPKALEPALLLINAYLQQNQPLKALSIARDIQDEHADNPVALQALAQAQLAAGETSSALSSYRKLTEKLPKSPQAQYLLAQAQMKSKDSKAAVASLNKALKVDPNFLPASVALADLELQDNHPKEALNIARQIQKQQDKSPAGYELEGNIHMRARAYADAAKAYAAAYQRSKSGGMAMKLSGARKQAGDNAGAYQALTQWLAEHPDDAGARTVLASTYQSDGKRKEAIEHYQKVLEKQPKNAAVLNNLGWVYYEQGDPRALEYAEKAYNLAKDQPAIMDTFGWVLVQQGQVKRGLDLLQSAVSKSPTSPDIRYHLAVALDKSGRSQEARKELERLLESNSDFSEAAAAKSLLNRLKSGG